MTPEDQIIAIIIACIVISLACSAILIMGE